ncbi:unnamed protein product [Fusarium graminearum]|nr:unnamed protein product [Fusarium graminearum]CAG1966898.1 unnamed protein product [Fusarium graminearum]CAG1990669.1 unnamed protein product [Fusarium graminearum]VTO91046.1 unnamed protein product [Fusarium graminearum]
MMMWPRSRRVELRPAGARTGTGFHYIANHLTLSVPVSLTSHVGFSLSCKAAVLCLSLPEFARKLARIGSKDYLQLVWKKDKKGYNSKVELATLATGLDHPSK